MLSVVIPCYNEENYILNLLSSLENQTVEKNLFEIIVVDNNSTDQTQSIVKKFNQTSPLTITLIEEHQKGVSRAKNTGAFKATQPHLVFLDADNTLGRNFLAAVIIDIDRGNQAATFKTLPSDKHIIGSSVFWTLEFIKQTAPRPFGKCHINRELFHKVGGYNEKIELGENAEFLLRVQKHLNHQDNHLSHITNPIRCSLRRFEKEGYTKILASWLIAYIGNWEQHYPTVDEL